MKSYSPSLFGNSFYANRLVRINLVLSGLVNFCLWLGLLLVSRDFLTAMPLHYNIYFGIDLYGPWYRIFAMPLSGLAIGLVNFITGSLIYRRDKNLSYFLVFTSTFCELLLALAAAAIIMVNVQ